MGRKAANMDYFTRRELRLLLEERGRPCISVYMPTERTGPESEKDRILLGNLLRDVREKLKHKGLRKKETEGLLEPLSRFLDSPLSWPCGCDGLAMFRSADLFRRFRLPVRFEPLAVVTDRFHVSPLLTLLMTGGKYYVLAVSRGEVHLYGASRQQIDEIDIPDAPGSIQETLRFDDPEKQLQFHTGTQSRGGRRAAVYHGQGVGTDESEANTLRFLHEVDKGVREVLREETAPLVLVAVEELQGLYRRVNSYPHLQDEGVFHNPEDMQMDELESRSRDIVEPVFTVSARKASEQYLELAGKGSELVASDIDKIVRAARAGQVGTLFVARGEHVWGDADSGDIAKRSDESTGSGALDLLDLAASETLLHGGRVYPIDAPDVPGGGAASAILRYPTVAKA